MLSKRRKSSRVSSGFLGSQGANQIVVPAKAGTQFLALS